MKREEDVVIGADVGEGLAFSGTSPPEASDRPRPVGAKNAESPTHPYCKRCSSHFCPHVKPLMWKDDPEGVKRWEEWLKKEGR